MDKTAGAFVQKVGFLIDEVDVWLYHQRQKKGRPSAEQSSLVDGVRTFRRHLDYARLEMSQHLVAREEANTTRCSSA